MLQNNVNDLYNTLYDTIMSQLCSDDCLEGDRCVGCDFGFPGVLTEYHLLERDTNRQGISWVTYWLLQDSSISK